jgi:hypothetical protein
MIPWKLDGALRIACIGAVACFVEVIEDQYDGAMPPCEYEESK